MAGSGMNILPQYQGDYYALQNKQALAQALMQQSLTPQPLPQAVGSGGSQNYQVMPKYSALSGAAELGKALLAAKMQQQAAQGLQGLGQNQMNFLMGSGQQPAPAASGMGGAPDGTTASAGPAQADPQALAQALGASGGASPPQQQAQPPQQAAPAQQQAPQQTQGGGLLAPGSAMNPSGMDVGKAAFLYQTMGPEAYAKEFVAPYVKPTDSTLNARQAGLTPAGVQAANLGAIQKNNFIAPVSGTGILRNPQTMQPMAYNPDTPAGTTPLFDASGNVQKVQPIAGAQGAMQGNAAATAAGSAQFKPVQVYDPQSQQMVYSNEAAVTNPSAPAPLRNNNPGAMMPGGKLASYPDMQTGLAALDTNLQSYGKSGVNTIAGVIGKWAPPNENNTSAYIADVSQRLGIPPNQKIDLSNPLQRQALSTAISLHENGPQGVFGGGQSGAPAAAPPLGAQVTAEKGAGNQQDELSKKWTDLTAANQQAQTTTSYLQSIKGLAAKAAVGPQSDKLNYVNGLLSVAGSRPATDMVDANNLLDKYSNQITSRLSANGMSTDSARSILQSAYPNSHMTQNAINEAADNLVGANQMTQAKAALLAPLANSRNSTAYNNTEMKFDQAADPRLWQLQNMAPAAQAQYVSTLPPATAKMLLQNRQVLKGMGALQ